MIKKLEDKKRTELLSRNYVGHLAFIDQGSPYIIPITYFYDKEGHYILSYSSEGHKIMAMRRNKQVSLCVDEIDSVNTWRSILVHGEFEEFEGSNAKYQLHEFSEGVKNVIALKEHRNLRFISEFSSKLESEGTPIVYRIKITEITGKYRED
jgi:hypothetical protein